jgi:hypothetical protein
MNFDWLTFTLPLVVFSGPSEYYGTKVYSLDSCSHHFGIYLACIKVKERMNRRWFFRCQSCPSNITHNNRNGCCAQKFQHPALIPLPQTESPATHTSSPHLHDAQRRVMSLQLLRTHQTTRRVHAHHVVRRPSR